MLLIFLVVRSFEGGPAQHQDAPPRALLDRPWFDHAPANTRDPCLIWVWRSSGLAALVTGTNFRGTYDFADFERSGSELRGTWLQDDAKFSTRFRVEPCDEAPDPFDLCLTFANPPKGPKRLYSIADMNAARKALAPVLKRMPIEPVAPR